MSEENIQALTGIFQRMFGESFIADSSTADTPSRIIKAWEEMTRGIDQDPVIPLSRQFEKPEDCDEMIVLTNIPFTSMCEHHFFPFTGKAHVGYIPSDKITGLSKIPRAIDICAARPQVQERLTVDIAKAISKALDPRGVAVVLEAEHGCMSCRGVRKTGVKTVTSHITGLFKTPAVKDEFINLINHE